MRANIAISNFYCQTHDFIFPPVQQMIEEIWIGPIFGMLISPLFGGCKAEGLGISKWFILSLEIGKHKNMLKCWNAECWIAEMLDCWNTEMLKCRHVEMLKFWTPELLKYWNAQRLKLWNTQMLKCWNAKMLRCWNAYMLRSWNT